MLEQGVHPEFLKHIDEIQASHDLKLVVAQKRFEMACQSMKEELDSWVFAAHRHFMKERGFIRHEFMRRTQDAIINSHFEVQDIGNSYIYCLLFICV
jgi:phage-related protein